MKPFAKRLLALASAAAITLTTIPAVRGTNEDLVPAVSADQVSDSKVRTMEELVPAIIRSATAAAPLTRQNLSTLVMDSYKSLTGLTDEDLGDPVRVFTDSDDTDVLNAHHLDLVPGLTAGIFAPDGTVTREDFWAVAVNLLESVGYPYANDITMDLSVYEDGNDIISYAKQPAQVLLCIGAITAEEGSALYPADTITIGEAEEILGRVADFYAAWEADPVEPQRYLGEEVAEFALNYVGCRYVRGGQGPNKFDCSGFVYYVYKNFGYSLKPGARNQWDLLGERVSRSDLLPGDLVFFSNNGRASGIFHVGIYIGNGQFVHAANSRKGVIVTDMDDDWYSRRYLGAKRAID